MSEQSSETVSNNDAAATAGKDQAGFSVELIEDKDVPEVLGLLKEFFFKVSYSRSSEAPRAAHVCVRVCGLLCDSDCDTVFPR